MSFATSRVSGALIALLVIAACGGVATPSGAPSSPSGVASPSTAASSAAPSPSEAANPSEAPPSEEASSAPVSPSQVASGGGVVLTDQCSLASKEEISAAVGQTVAAAVGVSGGGCSFNDASGALLVSFTYLPPQFAKSIYDSVKAQQGVQPVAGVGDEAFWIPALTSLAVKKGDAALMVGVALTLGDEGARREIGKKVAAIVVPRI